MSGQRDYPDINYTIRDIKFRGQEYFLQAIRLLDQYSEHVSYVGHNYRQNVWYGFIESQISYEQRLSFKEDLELLLQEYRALQNTIELIEEKYEISDINPSNIKKWQSIFAFLASSDVVTPFLLLRDNYNYAYPYLERMIEYSKKIVRIRNHINGTYRPKIFDEIDGKKLYTKLTEQFHSAFSRIFANRGDYKRLIARLRGYLKRDKDLKYQQIVDLAKQLIELQEAEKLFHETASSIHDCIGSCYKGSYTDWANVKSALDSLKDFFSEENFSFCAISKMSLKSFTDNKICFEQESALLNQKIKTINELEKRIMFWFTKESLNLKENSYNYCIRKIEGFLAEFDRLGNWISFMELLKQINAADLSDFVAITIEKNIDPQKVTGIYRKAFYRQWIENIISLVPELASFSRIRQDQAVQEFVKKDSLQYEINKNQIQAELSQQRPNLSMIAGGSAVAILRREASKRRKHLPIRKLLSETGSLVQIIKPCFLMSPLSVSTFLDSEKIRFDTVIFDEASQVFPQDAIGAIYRGKQLIVVGDSMQMPPSNFFNASMDIDEGENEDNIVDINDFESILDVSSGTFTTKSLVWHYRSHYEELIAFSNVKFYKNGLITFPSSSKDHNGIGVDYYHVDGVFDRESKTNKVEAEFIISLIYTNIKKYPDRSLGVIAFSIAQQNLIEKLLYKKRELDPSYEWFFKEDNKEKFFIKNLETVQGDERDTIIFSIAYAKDKQGRFIQNFGPLNKKGGERRLNVAVTRARDNILLVTSLNYKDFDLKNTESEGVKRLCEYLNYAQNGPKTLDSTITVSNSDKFDSAFEQEVCDFLRGHGFAVDTQVGCSGYKIDLGLKRPDSSSYLMAIECDGATYHSSKNARDRDCLRQRILESMGWRFYRIWSTDWYKNTIVEKERLLQAAKDAIEKDQLHHAETVTTINEDFSKVEIIESMFQNSTEIENDRFITEVKESSWDFPKYRKLDAMQILFNNNDSLQDAVYEILETEAPLSEEFLLRRIVYWFGREKITKTLREEYNRRMYRCEAKGIIRQDGFLFLEGKSTIRFRVPGDCREIKEVSKEELADGLFVLIKQNVAAEKNGLYRTIINLLGYKKLTEAIVYRLESALNLLKQHNLVKEEDEVLSLII